ncbi:MAG: MlaC/ttg2D family ABC transporter substrate-binding protein [Planctomycetota bacterium]|jgi:phospholipid transport system substrate-binding protein
MRSLWSAIIIILIASQGVNAGGKEQNDPNYPSDPNKLIRTKWDAVISILQKKDIDKEAKEKKINKIVSPIFDFPLMAKLSLGKDHWPKLTESQREKFTRLFINKLRTSYREKISLYTNEEVVFKPAVKKKSLIYIPMELKSEGKKIAVLHKLRKAGKRWKVYDVEIQGISILLTYRSQFNDILSRGTVEELLSRLEEPTTQ